MSTSLQLMPEWRFQCDSADALMILKALGGRLNDTEVLKAKLLGDKLTIERAKQARQMLEGLERAETHALDGGNGDQERQT